jgi:hypothetical protein
MKLKIITQKEIFMIRSFITRFAIAPAVIDINRCQAREKTIGRRYPFLDSRLEK